MVQKDLVTDDDDGGEVPIGIDLETDDTDLGNPLKSILPMWSADAESSLLQEQELSIIQPSQQLLLTQQEVLETQLDVKRALASAPTKKQS